MEQDNTNIQNTKLSPQDEQKYLRWATANNKINDTYDYDLRGAYINGLAGVNGDHSPDTFKKTNHPTFSNQSINNGVGGQYGGVWVGDRFAPSEYNMNNIGGLAGYQAYGRVAEGGDFMVPSLRSVLVRK
jgi:hypothetical protein